MRIRTRLVFTALTTALTMMVLVGTASANRLSFSNQNIRIVWSDNAAQSLTRLGFFSAENEAVNSRCNVTLEGSLHSRTMPKTPELLIGYITRAELAVASCTFAGTTETRILTSTLPWHIRYCAFTGTLPTNISVRLCLINASFSMTMVLFINCLYSSTAARPAVFDTSAVSTGTLVLALIANRARTILPRVGPTMGCPANATLDGVGLVRLLGTTDVLVSLWLI